MSVEFKPFRIKDIFTIKKVYGKPISSYVQGEIPYVTGAENNNGVVGYVTAAQADISEGNCISVDPIRGAACYQANDFVGRGFSGASVNLLYNASLTERNALYACAAIEKAAAPIAAYTNLFNSNRLADATITLPVKHALVPDWATLCSVVEGGCDMSNIDTSNWKEFKISTLFDWQNGDTDIKKADINGNGIPVISSGVENCGVIGNTDMTARVCSKNIITVDMFGNAFYRDFDYKMVTHARVFALLPKGFEMSERIGLYLVTQLSWLTKTFSYNNMCTYDKIKDCTVLLPATTEDVPDWAYMEERIGELEQERIGELEQERIGELDGYLKATGLNDYALTDEDKRVLSEVRTFKLFELPKIFNIINTHSILQSQIVENSGETPYLTAASENNAVQTKIDCSPEWIDKGNCIFIGGKTTVITYQEHDFCSNDSHNLALYLKDIKHRTRGVQLYIISALQRSLTVKYTWGDSISKKKIQNDVVSLPVKPNTTDEIDYAYMERYIKAMEKLVIADVVKYKDSVIETTKKIVAANTAS